jgi:glycosyltransferase involved in cell wall biosynthesis
MPGKTKKSSPLVSIVMPALNSEKTIEKALVAIRKQKFDQKLIEILVVDGGSTDKTKSIARKYGCRIVPNPRVQPECAKHEGILHAKGRYAAFLDTDEVWKYTDALQKRMEIFQNAPEVKFIMGGGYEKPPHFSAINDYIMNYSDPFSHFMYGISANEGLAVRSMIKKFGFLKDSGDYYILHFGEKVALPLVDISAGNTLDLDYLRSEFPQIIKDVNVVPLAFNLMTRKNRLAALLKKDAVIHYSGDSFRKYLNKIRWRIVINIHYTKQVGVGYSNREAYQPLWFRLKKYLFLLYAFTLVLPFLSGLWFAVVRLRPVLILHLPLTLYTAVTIVWQYILKIFGVKPVLKSYGK